MALKPQLFIICGVSASGKTTIGTLLAAELNCTFLEGDDYHPIENIQKMRAQTPLTDKDRITWIKAMVQHINAQKQPNIVLSCSALTPFVQTELKHLCNRDITWIKLELLESIARKRSRQRNHFMPPELIRSQFLAWSPPQGGISVDATQSPEEIMTYVMQKLETN